MNFLISRLRQATFILRLALMPGFYAVYKKLFDPSFYYASNPDVAESRLNPFLHFIRFGLKENRDPSPWIDLQHLKADQNLSNTTSLWGVLISKNKQTPHPLIDPVKWESFKSETKNDAKENLDLFSMLTFELFSGLTFDWWDSNAYVLENPDLKATKYLEHHFVSRGAQEMRFVGKGVRVLPEVHSAELYRGHVIGERFIIRGIWFVAVRVSPQSTIMSQVLELQNVEPLVLAASENFLPKLTVFTANNLTQRDSIDVLALERLADSRPEALVIVGGLDIGGGVKYAINLSLGLEKRMKSMILATEVDDGTLKNQVNEWRKEFPDLSSIMVSSFYGESHRQRGGYLLALLIQRIKPKLVFVVNSGLGYEAIRSFGRGISSYTSIFSVFFSQSPSLIGRPYSARYLESSSLVGSIMTDNEEFIKSQFLRLSTKAVNSSVVLPPCVSSDPESTFARDLQIRKRRFRKSSTFKAIWVGRWDEFKDLALLMELARVMPELEIDVIQVGRFDSGLETVPKNIRIYTGGLGWKDQDLSVYSLFIFTSLFEGMPNVILEAAERGLPIVTADVGGIRETLDEHSAKFYSLNADIALRLEGITKAVKETLSMTWDETEKQILSARHSTLEKHGSESFDRNIQRLLDNLAHREG